MTEVRKQVGHAVDAEIRIVLWYGLKDQGGGVLSEVFKVRRRVEREVVGEVWNMVVDEIAFTTYKTKPEKNHL